MNRAHRRRWAALLTAAMLAALAAAGCATSRVMPVPVAARFYLETDRAPAAEVTLPQSDVRIAIAPKPVITEFDVADVAVVASELGPCLRFQLNPVAARDVFRMTDVHVGRRLVLFLDGEPRGVWRSEQPVRDGALLVFLEVPDAELPALAEAIRAKTAELRRQAKF